MLPQALLLSVSFHNPQGLSIKTGERHDWTSLSPLPQALTWLMWILQLHPILRPMCDFDLCDEVRVDPHDLEWLGSEVETE